MLSIIIPVYNEEKLIEPMVRQFEPLTVPHEVIVSDTASTDGTVAAARRCADRVVELATKNNAGVSTGRNNGAAAARGDFLIFMDCGTTIPDVNAFFERALARFEQDPKLVGASARVEVEKASATWSDRAVSFLMNVHFTLLNKFLGVGMASGKFQMIRTDAFRKLGGFNEHLHTAEDVDFFGRLAKLGNTRVIWDLAVYHSGRRFHQRGAWITLFLWMKNAISLWLFKKPSEKWDPIR